MARLQKEQLLEIFYALKKEIQPYEKGNIKARINIEGKYDLWSAKKGMVILGKPRKEMGFVTLTLQSSYVGFYYMPIYCSPPDGSVRKALSPEFLKLLKGKACFHIKSTDKYIVENVATAMKIGYEFYEKVGWL
jgi:hypothetical protein